MSLAVFMLQMRGADVPEGVCPEAGGAARGQALLPPLDQHPAPGQGRSPHEGRQEQLQAPAQSGVLCGEA